MGCPEAAAAALAAGARTAFCRASSTAALDAIHRSTQSLCRTLSSLDGVAGPPGGAAADVGWPTLLPGGPAEAAAPPDLVTPEQRALARLYERALGAYQEARFAAARDLASALLERHPEDAATRRLLERVGPYLGTDGGQAVCLSDAERASWTGVFVMAEK
mmetsp:Transcript_16578/g.51900  ORF Transcript_16578/g.51900 Transcript_16578/m.51900 type:complete len:161 (+) Transcript_16578:330-812(+)